MEVSDILKVINGAGFVALPALAAWKDVDWYFERDIGGAKKSTNALFIAVAGMISGVLYSYLVWSLPSRWLIETSILWWFALSTAAVAIYYGLYTSFKGVVDNGSPGWVLPAALVSYITLLGAMALFCSAAMTRHDYLLLGGSISSEGKPLSGAAITLDDGNQKPSTFATSDQNGKFLLRLKYTLYQDLKGVDHPQKISVQKVGYNPDGLIFDEQPHEDLSFTLVPAK